MPSANTPSRPKPAAAPAPAACTAMPMQPPGARAARRHRMRACSGPRSAVPAGRSEGIVMSDAADRASPPPPGTFTPLRHHLFAVLWAATVLGNIGTFMRDVASAWIATEISPSPAAVAMIQVAGTLPVFLLAIPAGVLSDILDRRRYLIGIQIALGCVSALLALLIWTGGLSIEA